MKDVRPAFRELDNGDIVPIGYHPVNCHMIFDVNMEDLRHKSRLVVGIHVIDPAFITTYARVVLREIARIDFSLEPLNGMLMKVVEIQNYYTTAPVTEEI